MLFRSGENGAGKSTMLDALCFGLFQRPFRGIKKDQLINSINEKECIVEVEFTVGQKDSVLCLVQSYIVSYQSEIELQQYILFH